MNIFKRMSEATARMRASHDERYRQTRIAEINGAFSITERDSRVYILHNGTAIAEFDPKDNVEKIMCALSEVRGTAVKYEL